MKTNQVVHNYFSKMGKRSHEARIAKYGEEYMKNLSAKGVEARKRNAKRRRLVKNHVDPTRNCKICGADHGFIDDWNRATYRRAHEKYLIANGGNNEQQ